MADKIVEDHGISRNDALAAAGLEAADDATTTNDTSTTTDHTAPDGDQLGDGGKKALDAERTRAKEAERKWKAAEKALEAEKAKGLSESERAITEAKAAGVQEATLAAGKRVARAEIRAAAVAAGFDASDLLDDLDLSRFVADDGEPDDKAIADRVKRWAAMAPKPTRPSGNVDQGPRTSPSPSEQIAAAEAKGDWRAAGALKAQQLQALPKS